MPEKIGWHEGRCKSCGFEVRAGNVGINSAKDYHIFCTNPACKHAYGCGRYELQDIPDWVERVDWSCRIIC